MMKLYYERIKNFKKIKPYTRRLIKFAVFYSILKICFATISLLSPLLYKFLIDDVMINKNIELFKWICLGYIFVFLLESGFSIAETYNNNLFYNRLKYNLQRILWRKYMTMPLVFFENYDLVDLKKRVDEDVNSIDIFIKQQVFDYIYSWLNIIIYFFAMIVIRWQLALFAFIIVPLSFLITKWQGKTFEKYHEEDYFYLKEIENKVYSCIKAWKEIKALVIEKMQNKYFDKLWNEYGAFRVKLQLLYYLNSFINNVKSVFLTKMLLYFLGGLFIINGHITIGSMMIFIEYFQKFYRQIETINNNNIEFYKNTPAINRVMEMFDQKIINNQKPIQFTSLAKGIELKDVCFKYNKSNKYILSNINLNIHLNDKLAIVGRSGSGKTTLIKLIIGLYNPIIGIIKLNDYNIKDISKKSIYKNIGVVMQDSILFNMSIKDNLLLAKPKASKKEIIKSCKMANIHHFINSLSNGYDTIIGENGVKLSGGQKQRLAIARTLIRDPKIIIFDEATSSLDFESERLINLSIDEISKQKTVIIIAHRLSSLLLADRVIVMDEGKIVGDGTHHELLDKNSIYFKLFKEQYTKNKIS